MELARERHVVKILTVNAGSTSVKLDVVVDGVATTSFESLSAAKVLPPPDAVAHRIVHGGARTEPTIVDSDVRRELGELVDLDPLHDPPALDAIDQCARIWPSSPQVACFDTMFHATVPAAIRHYALPQPWRDQLPAYGFHGLSHAWAARRAGALAPGARRIVIAHLGGGSSLCGVLDGKSRVTTMGFTPLDGLVMATRVGRIDPGAVLWLAAQPDIDAEDVLARRSGLTGLAGTGDMREVLAQVDRGDEAAGFALDVWEHRFLAELGGCVATLDGLDVLVFTGGIGEHATALRTRICGRLGWLGVAVSGPPRTGPGGPEELELSTPGSPVRVFVVPAREDLMLAELARQVVAAS